MRIGVIGGGDTFAALGIAYDDMPCETPFGAPSAPMRRARHGAHELFSMLRHGGGHKVGAHQVNYRANIWAFHQQKVDLLLGVSICGSLDPEVELGSLAIYDQIIDFTRSRPSTFFDRGDEVRHADVGEPVCNGASRAWLIERLGRAGLRFVDGGAMVVIEGPRFSTRAESRMFALLGGRFITMSAAPEAFLARELGLCYLPISLVTDHDTVGAARVTAEQIGHSVDRFRDRVPGALAALLADIDAFPPAPCTCCAGVAAAVPVDRLNLSGRRAN